MLGEGVWVRAALWSILSVAFLSRGNLHRHEEEVFFPTDEQLEVHLPEWQPRDRGARSASARREREREGRLKLKSPSGTSDEQCPDFNKMHPCTCREKNSGLDITCESVKLSELEKVTRNLKEHTDTRRYRDFKQIGYFKVRNSPIPELPDYLFMGLSIVHLTFFDCGLQRLSPNSLSSLAGSLNHLMLSNNELIEVPTIAFRQLRELDHVNLNQNNITVLKDGAFWGLSKVTRLTLYDNKINTIHPDAFDGLTKWTGLAVFDTTANCTSCPPRTSEPSTGDLLRLNVARNSLSEVPSEALLQLKNLNQLDLSFNKIKYIEENTFAGMDKLDTLNLNNNKIEELGPRFFEGMPRVTSLKLDYNKIKTIHDEAFYGLEEQLQSLSLQSNKISRFPTASLRPLHQLKTLHLNDNNVSALSEGDFQEFGDHLQNLWLDNNWISDIPTPTFEDLTSLEWLKLNNNKLRTLPYELVEPILDTVKHIDIHGNPLVCDCEMKWYKKWWEGDWQKIDTDHIKEIKCLSPEDNSEHIMKDVDIEEFFCESASEATNTTSRGNLERKSEKVGFLLLPILLLLLLNKQPLCW